MGHKYILTTSLLLALGVALGASLYYDLWIGCGILIGAGWGCANFYCLKILLAKHLKNDKSRQWILALIKFPILYGVGYGILKTHFFPPLSLLIGFSLSLIAIVFIGLRSLAANKELLHDDRI